MKKLPFCPPALRAPHSRFSMAAFLLGGAVLLAGCASSTPRSLGTLPAPDQTTLKQLTENLAAESAKLAATRDELQRQIEKRTPAPLPAAISPRHDPLEDIVVSVKLQNANLGSIMQVLAEQARMNMLVDPEVLAIDKRASLYLNRVTARELYRHILEAFDLSGQTEGNTIKIGMFDERFFNIDFLNSRMSVDIASGGNVFGSNSGGGGNSGSNSDQIRGNISLSGGSGKQVEPYDQLEANLKRLVGVKETEGVQIQEKDEDKKRAVFTLNRSSGTLFVRARPSHMRMVEKMIERYKTVLYRQVLIEAQLLDVELNDSFQFGVDWNLMRNRMAAIAGAAPLTVGTLTATAPGNLPLRTLTFPAMNVGTSPGNGGGLLYTDKNVSAALTLLRSFGNVKVLSNPSIRVRNNIPALLSVGTTNRFVAKSSVTVTNPGGGAATTTSDVQTDSIFGGVIVGVVPFIGERGDVDLLIHPMQTEVDPESLLLQDVGGGNRVTLPRVSYKGMTTTLNIKDGDTVIMGGLIDQNTSNRDNGVPGLSDAPFFGKAFGKESSTHRSRELIMVLRVKLL